MLDIEYSVITSDVIKTFDCTVVVDFLFIVTPIMGVCFCSMFCCT